DNRLFIERLNDVSPWLNKLCPLDSFFIGIRGKKDEGKRIFLVDYIRYFDSSHFTAKVDIQDGSIGSAVLEEHHRFFIVVGNATDIEVISIEIMCKVLCYNRFIFDNQYLDLIHADVFLYGLYFSDAYGNAGAIIIISIHGSFKLLCKCPDETESE